VYKSPIIKILILAKGNGKLQKDVDRKKNRVFDDVKKSPTSLYIYNTIIIMRMTYKYYKIIAYEKYVEHHHCKLNNKT